MPKLLTAALAIAAAAAFLVGEALDIYALRLIAKPVPVLVLAWMVKPLAGRYAHFIFCGLLCCVLGDVLLEVRDSLFLFGVGAFLVGHLFYIAAYVHTRRTPCWWRAVPFALWAGAVLWSLHPGLQEQGMVLPVTVYTLVICTMMWRAAALLEAPAGTWALAAFFGALLFAASDTLIAVNRFHVATPGAGYLIIISYWLGQLGITSSALRSKASSVIEP